MLVQNLIQGKHNAFLLHLRTKLPKKVSNETASNLSRSTLDTVDEVRPGSVPNEV